MDFFKSVFAEDPETSDTEEEEEKKKKEVDSDSPRKPSEIEEEEEEVDRGSTVDEADQNPNSKFSGGGGGGWSFGGFIKTFASKSESVLQTYRRDLEEFGSGLKKETAVIRQVASKAVKELPASLEVGASVAQESLESVGQAIDDFGSTVWKGTTGIISQGKEALLAVDSESDSSDSQAIATSSVKRYSRFETQVHAIQSDLNTYCEDPEDLDDFSKWKSGFVLPEQDEEMENLLGENGAMEGVYTKLVPITVDHETFWTRYFYRIHRLKQAEDARANLVKRAISGDEDEDLSWDVDDDDEESNVPLKKGDSSENNELVSKHLEESRTVSSSEVVGDIGNDGHGAESISGNGNDEKMPSDEKPDLSSSSSDDSVEKSGEKLLVEGKAEPVESCKDSDFSVVSSQPSLPEEEDLGWDEIEDLSSIDEKKVVIGGSPNKADLRKRLSAADEEEDLSWDIEDDDVPAKS